MADFIIGAVIAGVIVLAVRSLRKDRGAGKPCGGCCGSCEAGCALRPPAAGPGGPSGRGA